MPQFLESMDELTSGFAAGIIEYGAQKHLSDKIFDEIVGHAVNDLIKIQKECDAKPDEDITSWQFAELVMIRSLIPKLQAIMQKDYFVLPLD